jgi:hypothetical protein
MESLISGPVGMENFLASVFAKVADDVGVQNFRYRWVGSRRISRRSSTFVALAPIVVLIDAADASLGGEGGGDSGVNQRSSRPRLGDEQHLTEVHS